MTRFVKSSDNGYRRKLTLLEDNAKYRHLKILTCKGTLRQVFICLRLRTAYALGHTGKWGGGGESEPERRLEGLWLTKLVEIPTCLTVFPVYKL
jgi:hypothetical protein